MIRLAAPALLAALALAAPAQAQRMEASVDCAPTEAARVYDCRIALASGGEPVEGAVFTVKPDMPAMPMAHNIAPQPARATEEPGVYETTLPLEMHGRWSLRLDVTEPRRDAVILHREFEPEDDAAGGHGSGGHGGRAHGSGGRGG